jgi:hypothetical protein
MTKEQFLEGTQFYIGRKNYKGAETYSYNAKDSYITKQIRSSIDERVVVDDHECNVIKVGRTGFTGIAFIMRKKVVVKYKFEDLVEFEDEGPQYDGAGFSIEDREDDPEEQYHHCDDPSCNCSI